MYILRTGWLAHARWDQDTLWSITQRFLQGDAGKEHPASIQHYATSYGDPLKCLMIWLSLSNYSQKKRELLNLVPFQAVATSVRLPSFDTVGLIVFHPLKVLALLCTTRGCLYDPGERSPCVHRPIILPLPSLTELTPGLCPEELTECPCLPVAGGISGLTAGTCHIFSFPWDSLPPQVPCGEAAPSAACMGLSLSWIHFLSNTPQLSGNFTTYDWSPNYYLHRLNWALNHHPEKARKCENGKSRATCDPVVSPKSKIIIKQTIIVAPILNVLLFYNSPIARTALEIYFTIPISTSVLSRLLWLSGRCFLHQAREWCHYWKPWNRWGPLVTLWAI